MRTTIRHVVAMIALAGLLAACNGVEEPEAAQDSAPAEDTEEPEPEPVPEPEPDEDPEPEDTEEPAETDDATGDLAGQEPGVLELSDPVIWSEAGLELEIEAIRIISVDELSEAANEDFTDFLEDPSAVTLIGMRVKLRNTTEDAVEWFAAGFDTAVVIDGQQGSPFFLGDLGDTVRAGAETEINAYYESRVPVDAARDVGEFLWDAGNPVDPESFETVAEVGDLIVTYGY